jgi:hypothetical protein
MEGLQTKDFFDRLEKRKNELPELILQLSEVLTRMVEETELPTRGDIARLHGGLREVIGSRDELIRTCGNDGKICGICPFMAYVPTEIHFASESQPFCLPWIAWNRGN